MNIKRTLKTKYPEHTLKRRKDGRYYKHIGNDTFQAPTYDGLIEKIYEKLYKKQSYTLSDIYPEWMRYRRDIEKKSSRTLDDHKGYWNNYMKDSKLVKMPIEKSSLVISEIFTNHL